MERTSQRTRVIVVGIGGRGRWAAKRVAEDERYELVALCERDQAQLERMRHELRLDTVPGYDSLDACLGGEQADAVIVTTGDSHHAETVVPALEAGKHVFVEKPLEVTAEKCRAIVAADRRAGGKTFVGFNLRYAPLYVQARELIEAGAIGDILTIQADEFYDGGRTYFRRWNRLREYGGGLWITKACHDFDILLWMTGGQPLSVYALERLSYYTPREKAPLYCDECAEKETCCDSHFVIAQAEQSKREAPGSGLPQQPPLGGRALCLFNSDKDTFDHGVATIEFERGILATYTCNVVSGFSNRRLRVSGTKGTLDGDLHSDRLLLWHRDPARKEEIPLHSDGSGHGGADESILTSFHDFTKGRGEPKVRPEQAMIPVLIGLAATRSADEARRVEMSEFDLPLP